jgi:hypothetical protein
MINVETQIQNLQNLSTKLAAKAEELSASLLVTDDDAVSNLKAKLLKAVDALNSDIKSLQNNANNANANKKWRG